MRHPADGIEDRRELGLLPAVTGGYQQVGEPRRDQIGDRGGGQPSQPFGLLRAVAQRGDELGADGAGGRDVVMARRYYTF